MKHCLLYLPINGLNGYKTLSKILGLTGLRCATKIANVV